MTKLIVGLGNIGPQYQLTRHNIGFLFLDWWQKKHQLAEFKLSSKFKCLVSKNKNFYLIKPTTYMNLSGEAVSLFSHYYKIEDFKNIMVVFDDLDLKFGKFKLQLAKGPKTHSGLYSIYQHLQTKEFYHLRLGIKNQFYQRDKVADYVLTSFSDDEQKNMLKLFSQINLLIQQQSHVKQ